MSSQRRLSRRQGRRAQIPCRLSPSLAARLNGFRQNPPRSSSLSSVPKPLKFLRPHYDTLKENLEKLQDRERQASLADVISLLAMTKRSGPNEMPESLKYRLKGSGADVGQWGHEYVRNLAAEVGQEYTRCGPCFLC